MTERHRMATRIHRTRRIYCKQPVVDLNRSDGGESEFNLTVSSTVGTQPRHQRQIRIDVAKTAADDVAHSRWGAPRSWDF